MIACHVLYSCDVQFGLIHSSAWMSQEKWFTCLCQYTHSCALLFEPVLLSICDLLNYLQKQVKWKIFSFPWKSLKESSPWRRTSHGCRPLATNLWLASGQIVTIKRTIDCLWIRGLELSLTIIQFIGQNRHRWKKRGCGNKPLALQ